jgi:surface polysaccharide O-acyltransferase-like enzyme
MNIKIVNLRAFAITLVVLGHSIILYDPNWASAFGYIVPKCGLLYLLKMWINALQMPLFFSISGYLYYYSIQKSINIKLFLVSKFKRLFIPFSCFLFFWSDVIKIIFQVKGYQLIDIPKLLINHVQFLSLGHLWFLPTLLGIFVLSCLFVNNALTSKKIDVSLFSFVFIMHIISRFATEKFLINNILFYFVFFYIGLLINKYKISQKNKTLFSQLAFSCFAIFSWFLAIKVSHLFVFFTIVLLYIIIPAHTCRFIKLISKNSYGIYLIHSPLIYITYKYFSEASPLYNLLTNFILWGSLSLLITILLRKNGLYKLLGEKSKENEI